MANAAGPTTSASEPGASGEEAPGPRVGAIVGAYRLDAVVGAGRMGTVFVGAHTQLGRQAAVKILGRQHSTDPELVRRFFDEARAASETRHPGIVEIYDVGLHASGEAFVAMELLEGVSLEARVEVQPIEAPLAVEILRQLADALGAAHRAGVVHRDLKPANVFLVRDATLHGQVRVKLLDFGIAALAPDVPGTTPSPSGALVGTPAYTSPEQWKRDPSIDERADVYALGCVAYHLVAGRPPFVADNLAELVLLHSTQPPERISELVPVSRRLAQAIDRMLAKDRNDRFASMDEVVAELAAVDEGPLTPTDRPPSPVRASRAPAAKPARARRSVLALALGVFALAAGAAAAAAIYARAHEAPAAQAPTPPVPPPAPVRLSIDSEPRGAEIYRAHDGVLLGTTPRTLELERRPGLAIFILRLAGYQDARLELSAEADSSVSPVLIPAPFGPAPAPP